MSRPFFLSSPPPCFLSRHDDDYYHSCSALALEESESLVILTAVGGFTCPCIALAGIRLEASLHLKRPVGVEMKGAITFVI